MRICLVHQYYKNPQSGGAIRSYYIAKYLTEKGHDVTVITARNNKAYSVDTADGYEVHNLPIYYSNHLSFLSRIHAFLLFVWSTNRLMKKLPHFDLNYVISTPLSTGLIALKSKRRNTPYIFEVGDLWPDAPIQLGVIKNPLLKWLAYRFEKKVYRDAKSIVALSPDIKENILTKVPERKVEVITNLADLKYFNPVDTQKTADKEKFVIAYLGSMGMANHLEYLVEVAKALSNDNRFHFIIMGAGARQVDIEKKAALEQVDNIEFLAQRDKKGVLQLMKEVDAIYVSFLNAPILSSGSPNKFFDGLAAGKLIIINFKGWVKTLIEKHECGFYHDPTQPEGFLELIKPYLESKEKLAEAQQNARLLAKQFTPEVQLAQLDEIITL